MIYKQNSGAYTVKLRDTLLLETELVEACSLFKTNPDVYVTLDMIIGVVLPNRLAKYQMDFKAGISRLVQGEKDFNLSDYAAMRLAADLTGIVTPPSLVGHTASDFQIEKYGSALMALTQFVGSYMKAFPLKAGG